MFRYATVPAVLLCLGAGVVGVSRAAPEWAGRAGLDFWNVEGERANLREAAEQEEDVDARLEAGRRRSAVLHAIVTALCEGRATPAESVEAVLAVARAWPEWFALTGDQYRTTGLVGPGATDRDVAVRCLLLQVKAMRQAAEASGDPSRVAVPARLAELEAEARLSPRPTPPPG